MRYAYQPFQVLLRFIWSTSRCQLNNGAGLFNFQAKIVRYCWKRMFVKLDKSNYSLSSYTCCIVSENWIRSTEIGREKERGEGERDREREVREAERERVRAKLKQSKSARVWVLLRAKEACITEYAFDSIVLSTSSVWSFSDLTDEYSCFYQSSLPFRAAFPLLLVYEIQLNIHQFPSDHGQYMWDSWFNPILLSVELIE